MDHLLLFTLLFSGLGSVSSRMPRRFHFVNQSETWDEAQEHCRHKFTDLATVENMFDMTTMTNGTDGYDMAWIGLRKDTWMWSLQDKNVSLEETNFTSWGEDEPNNLGGQQDCVALFKGYWYDVNCDGLFFSICEGGNPNERYTLINEVTNWNGAQKYCRSKHTNLLRVRNQNENNKISQIAKNKWVWIGLFKGWKWSDQTNSVFTFWRPDIPDNYGGNKDCAVTWRKDEGKWGDRNCTEKHLFFCYENKLALIRENKTWMEAFNYCESNDMELVSVTDEDTQSWAREVARGASTAHVWMGLYYICPLDVWFWISGVMVGCKDWAGTVECCRAGALQSGGELKRVSLPETERLNFICRVF